MDIRLDTFSRREVLQYLRWRGGEIEPQIDHLIDTCMEETLRIARPRYCWSVFPIDRQAEQPRIAFSGNDIRRMLEECDRVILFAATLGTEFEMHIRRAQVRDLAKALVLDACGSAAIEAVCDCAAEEIQREHPDFQYFTDRFSPGYGDLDIGLQHSLLALTNASGHIGLTATDSHILIPRKSVTALIGIAARPQELRFRGCAYCSMFENCSYRKAGKTCGRL